MVAMTSLRKTPAVKKSKRDRHRKKGRRRPPMARPVPASPSAPASTASAFDITIATVSDGESREEVALVKAALLYGDRVTLLSPSTELVLGAASLTHLPRSDQLEAFATIMGGVNPEASEAILAIMRKRRRSPAEIALLQSFEASLRPVIQGEWFDAVEGLASQVGVSELLPAMEAGLVTIKPLLEGASDDMIDRLVEEVTLLLNDPGAYPLFDHNVGAVASAGVREGLFALHDGTSRHSKQAGLAEGLFGYLPTFPQATVEQILELREEIRAPRIRFREAVSSLSRGFSSESFDEDFGAEVQDAWVEKVAPTLLEIEETLTESRLRRLIAPAFTTNEAVAGGLLGVAATAVADPGNMLAAVAGLNVGAAATATAKAIWDGVSKRREAHQNGFYLLHQTNDALARSA